MKKENQKEKSTGTNIIYNEIKRIQGSRILSRMFQLVRMRLMM